MDTSRFPRSTGNAQAERKIPRSTNFAAEHAERLDRKWFDEHPGKDEFRREMVVGEFDYPGSTPLAAPPPGHRRAVHVSLLHRSGHIMAIERQGVFVPTELCLSKAVPFTFFPATI